MTDPGGGDMMTRDLSTLGEDGPQITQFETPAARGLQDTRPAYSPVAQPGMNEEIWFHTVESARQARTDQMQPTDGMISRLNSTGQPQLETATIGNGGSGGAGSGGGSSGGGRRRRKRKRPRPPRRHRGQPVI